MISVLYTGIYGVNMGMLMLLFSIVFCDVSRFVK